MVLRKNGFSIVRLNFIVSVIIKSNKKTDQPSVSTKALRNNHQNVFISRDKRSVNDKRNSKKPNVKLQRNVVDSVSEL